MAIITMQSRAWGFSVPSSLLATFPTSSTTRDQQLRRDKLKVRVYWQVISLHSSRSNQCEERKQHTAQQKSVLAPALFSQPLVVSSNFFYSFDSSKKTCRLCLLQHACNRLHLPVVVVEVLLEVLRWSLLVGVVLVLATVVLVVQLLSAALGLVLSLLAVVEVFALGLGESVDLSTGEASEELFGELVGDWLAWNDSVLAPDLVDNEKRERRGNLPSLRWRSSNILKAAKEAPPARSS